MVVDSLECRQSEQKHGLASAHERERLGEDTPERVEDQPLYGVVVQRPERVWHV